MIINIENPDALRTWLSSTLAPICDADPAALAKYVMALLKKDKPEQDLKEFCIDQLDVFLQRETKPFVEKLFTVIKDRSYQISPSKVTSTTAEPSSGAASVSAVVSKPSPIAAVESPTVTRNTVPATSTSSITESGRTGRSESRSGRKRSPSPSVYRGPHRRLSRSRSRERTNAASSKTVIPDRRHDQRQPRDQQRREIDKENRSSRSRRSPPAVSSTSSSNAGSSSADGRGRGSTRRKGDRGGSSGSDEEKPTKERKKQRCRDFDEKGFCMRGDLCPYDHGPDPVVVDDIALPTMISSGPAIKPPTTPGGTPNFAIPPPGYGPGAPGIHPPPPGLDGGAYQQPEGYNPEAPGISVAVPPPGYSRPPPAPTGAPRHPPPIWTHQPPPFLPQPPSSVGVSGTAAPPLPVPLPVPLPSQIVMNRNSLPPGRELITLADTADGSAPRTVIAAPVPVPSMIPFRQPPIGSKRPFGMGTGPPGSHAGPRTAAPYDKTNCTLEVRRIPSHLNTISKLNEHFAQFGHIVNIQVRYENDPEAALVTFASRPQAVSAYKSTAPILNNRFIKIFWHGKDMAGEMGAQGGNGGRLSIKDRLGLPTTAVTSSGQVSTADGEDISMRARGPSPTMDEDGNRRAVLLTTSGNLTRTVYNPEALAAAASHKVGEKSQGGPPAVAPFPQQKPLQQPTSQPPLMGHPKMMRKHQKLQEAMKKSLELQKAKADLLKKQVEQQKLLLAQLEKCTSAAQKKEIIKTIKDLEKTIKAATEDLAKATKQSSMPVTKSKETLEKEMLDTELELIRQKQAGAETGDLQRRLTEVRLELTTLLARSLASSDQKTMATSTPVQSVGDGGSRQYPIRKRRPVPETSVLDKRPRDLVITGFAVDEKDLLIEHLQHYGMLEDIEFHHSKGDPQACRATAIYKTRREAEMALSDGSEFGNRQLTIQWAHQRAASVSDSAGAAGAGGSGADAAPHSEMTAGEILATLDDDDDEDEDEEDGEKEDDEVGDKDEDEEDD